MKKLWCGVRRWRSLEWAVLVMIVVLVVGICMGWGEWLVDWWVWWRRSGKGGPGY
ncbi:MAG: hypothetical protein KAW89_01925 [Armatimonadetes bacterium]|nr:hypothetical protein [Armatimonadota bacterium]